MNLQLTQAPNSTALLGAVIRPLLVATVLFGLWRALARAGLDGRQRLVTWGTVATVLVGWLTLVWTLAARGVLAPPPDAAQIHSAGMIVIPTIILVVAALAFLTRSATITAAIDAAPLWWLVAYQAYRVTGFIFVRLWSHATPLSRLNLSPIDQESIHHSDDFSLTLGVDRRDVTQLTILRIPRLTAETGNAAGTDGGSSRHGRTAGVVAQLGYRLFDPSAMLAERHLFVKSAPKLCLTCSARLEGSARMPRCLRLSRRSADTAARWRKQYLVMLRAMERTSWSGMGGV